MAPLARLAPAALVALALLVGCGRRIGDPCDTNVSCSALGDRFCDVSSPGGYCTIEGCDVNLVNGQPVSTCPDDAVCVRFFEPLAGCPCNPATAARDCLPGERCLCDQGDPDRPGECADNGAPDEAFTCAMPMAPTRERLLGHCAPESSERRSCQRRCNSDGDCRAPDYECRQTGTLGAEPVPTMVVRPDGGLSSVPSGPPAKFCVQKRK